MKLAMAAVALLILTSTVAHADPAKPPHNRIAVESVDGSKREPAALVIRYSPANGGPTMFVARNGGVAWNGKETLAQVMKLVKAHRKTKVVEIDFARHMDASALDALLIELSRWGNLRLIVVNNKGELGWLDVVFKASGGTPLTVTQDPKVAALTTSDIVTEIAKLSPETRRAGVTLTLLWAPPNR